MSPLPIPVVSPVQAYLGYRAEMDAAIERVLTSGWYILGQEVAAFEAAFASFAEMAEMIGVGNGTDAIHLALRTLEIGQGDIVVTASHTAVATVAAIELAGATAVLVDVEPQSYTLDPHKLDETLAQLATEGTPARAVIAIHIYGHPCDTIALASICERHGVALIEDCAQAHGARIGNRHVGSAGQAACFSFYPTKNLAAFGDGGSVGFNDAALAARCRALREYGWQDRYLSDLQGMNSRLDELHAAMLAVRLGHLDAEMERRRAVARIYDAGLADHVATPPVRPGCEHAYHLYVVRTRDRDSLARALAAEGIGTGVHYPAPVHSQRAYAGRIRIGAGGMEVTERIAGEILSLPMHGFLPDADAHRVVEAVARVFRNV